MATSAIDLLAMLTTAMLTEDLVLGFFGGTAIGTGVTGVGLDVIANDNTVRQRGYSGLLPVDAVNLGSLGTLTSGSQPLDVKVSLHVTSTSIGAGFYGGVVIGL